MAFLKKIRYILCVGVNCKLIVNFIKSIGIPVHLGSYSQNFLSQIRKLKYHQRLMQSTIKSNKMPILCVIASQIQLKGTKILRIFLKKFCEYGPSLCASVFVSSLLTLVTLAVLRPNITTKRYYDNFLPLISTENQAKL